MNQQQCHQFLSDPTTFLNAGNVSEIRLHGSMAQAANAVSRIVNQAGGNRLRYKFSAARVTPVTLKYDDTGIPQTSALWVSGQPPATGGDYQRDRAYYLQWGVDQAYAIELGFDAQLFFTAELTGCGILVFSAPNKLVVVHHNIQVNPIPQTVFQRLFESAAARQRRETAHVANVQTEALHNLAQDIIASSPGITGGTQLSVRQYGNRARVFGVKRGRWCLFVNRRTGGGNYQTELLYVQ